jgi:hypothetical protein
MAATLTWRTHATDRVFPWRRYVGKTQHTTGKRLVCEEMGKAELTEIRVSAEYLHIYTRLRFIF